ncbi:MAG: hypothetical protein O3B20_03220 [Bacteroidetes bacterium]|jgi:hypothetical protein|nr:MAG: hypothetical protein ABR86_01720 [Cryomorphaceae bacterium BACL23 MAG-120924-bin60]MBL6627162.1 hypothetical protein [Cryomorphaceae bacterium]MDA0363935.1 hypothetical protein [Bacteroidota bacterium]MDA0828478.1 hypothetical protein [Bacteroidota bacterium]MDA1199078.1 hypothetical protein [Bacteroidota bacterium]
MNFWQRFSWYAVGLGLGTLLVIFLFSGRDFQCTYLPNNRVLVDLHDQPVRSVAPEAQDPWQQACAGDSAFLEAFLMRGEIDFSEAQVTTREEGLKHSSYPITLEWQDQSYQGWWERRTDSAVLIRLERLAP